MSIVQRRSFLRGAGIGAATAVIASGAVAFGAISDAKASETGPEQDLAQESIPFYGAQQAGVYRPAQQQAASCFAAFKVLCTTQAEFQTLLKALSQEIAFLTTGGAPANLGPAHPPADSEILGADIVPDGLTVTVALGGSLFDNEKLGLSAKKPVGLTPMRKFPNDSLNPQWVGGDLLLQICAHHVDTVHHALRSLLKVSRGHVELAWKINGFVSPSRPDGAPRNLLGYKDGTANPSEPESVVFIDKDSGQPEWAIGGTFVVVRLIRMFIEFWDRVAIEEQNLMIGRYRDTGAPLDGAVETDVPNYEKDPKGEVTPMDSHIRLANPRTPKTESERILRRGYNYDLGIDGAGNLDVGLIFACYMKNIQKQFEAIQTRLIDEPLIDYISPIGGGYFIALPGVTSASSYLGAKLFDA